MNVDLKKKKSGWLVFNILFNQGNISVNQRRPKPFHLHDFPALIFP